MEKVGMPTINSFKDSAIDYGLGLGGGVLYALSTSFTGSGLLGGLIGAGIAGSVIKGVRGTALATILGFQTIIGNIGAVSAATESPQEVM